MLRIELGNNKLKEFKFNFSLGYLERNVLLAKQDAHEQKQKLDCLILRGPFIPNVGEVQFLDICSR